MAFDLHKNFAYSTVATAPSPATSGTSLVVAAGEGAKFPAVPFNVVIWPTGGSPPTAVNAEIARVTAISTDTLTIVRSTTTETPAIGPRTIVVGDQIAAGPTVKTLTDVEAAFASYLPLTGGTISGTLAVGGIANIETNFGNYLSIYGGNLWGPVVSQKVAADLSGSAILLKNYLGIDAAGGTTTATFTASDNSLDISPSATGTYTGALFRAQTINITNRVPSRSIGPMDGLTIYLEGSGSGGTSTYVRGVNVQGNVGSGHTMAALLPFYIADAIGAGTLTSQVGIVIDALAKGVNNTSLLMGQTSPPSGNWGLYSATPYTSYLLGDLLLGTTVQDSVTSRLYSYYSLPGGGTKQMTRWHLDYFGTPYTTAYAPVELTTSYRGSTIDPFVGTYNGLQSTLYYGSQFPSVAAAGQVQALGAQVVSLNSSDFENEQTPLLLVIRFDNNNNAFGNTTPGRGWLTDFGLHGAINQQQGCLNGVSTFVNNHYNGPPRDTLSGAYWAMTAVASGTATEFYHADADTYPIGVGYGVIGTTTGGSTRGWEVGIQIGGGGSAWNLASSHLGTGIDLADFDTAGLYVHGKFRGIVKLLVTKGGSGFTSLPYFTFSAPNLASGFAPLTWARLTPTSVASATVTNGGSGYTTAPTVTIDAPTPSGTTATAHAVLTGAVVTSIVMDTLGSGYTRTPNVTLSGGGGGGALVTVLLTATSLASISITDPGKGYTAIPTVTVNAGGGSGATVLASIASGGVTDAYVTASGSGYSSSAPPTVTFAAPPGSGGTINTTAVAGAITAAVVNAAGSLYAPSSTILILVAGGTGGLLAVPTNASGQLSGTVVIMNGGTGYTTATGAATSISTTQTAMGTAVVNITGLVTGIYVTDQGQGYTAVPTVTIAAPAPITATGTAAVSGGAVTSVTITAKGGFYASPPVVTFGGPGTGAVGTAIMQYGQVVRVRIDSPGTGYSSATVTFGAPAAGTQATATATLGGRGIWVGADAGDSFFDANLVCTAGLSVSRAPSGNVAIPANGSLTLEESYALASGLELKLGLNAVMGVHG